MEERGKRRKAEENNLTVLQKIFLEGGLRGL